MPPPRQSYDISIVAQVDQTGSKSSNLLDLKNPFFRWGWGAALVGLGALGRLPPNPHCLSPPPRYTGTTPSPPPGSHYTSPSENMWNTGSSYNMSSGMAVAGASQCSQSHQCLAGGRLSTPPLCFFWGWGV